MLQVRLNKNIGQTVVIRGPAGPNKPTVLQLTLMTSFYATSGPFYYTYSVLIHLSYLSRFLRTYHKNVCTFPQAPTHIM